MTGSTDAAGSSGALVDAVRELIVTSLMLEGLSPASIDADAPLFGAGLGLDSIDALELAIAVENQFGVKIRSEDAGAREIFRSVRTLAAHIENERSRRSDP